MDLDAVAGRVGRRISDQRREAAVLAPVVELGDDQGLVFIKRAEDLGEHPGQMAFPGGGREPDDESRYATVLREAREEIGLQPAEVEMIGKLDDVRTISEYAVTPYVAEVPDREYEPDGVEAIEVATLSLSSLLDPENYEVEQRDHPHYGDVVVHYFHVDGYTVWGVTGRILVDLLERTTDWSAPVRTKTGDQ